MEITRNDVLSKKEIEIFLKKVDLELPDEFIDFFKIPMVPIGMRIMLSCGSY